MSFDPDLKGGPLAESTFDLLRAGATLITSTPRLSREVTQAYNQSQLQDGRTSWNTPDVLPYPSWIERIWRAMRSRSDSRTTAPDVALSLSQSRQLWKNIIQQDIRTHGGDTEPLWNINATVRSAMEAWRICQQWHIDFNDFDDFCLTDHLSFARWGKEYQSLCRKRRWLDSYQLPAHITAQIKQGMQADWPHLIWAGFDNLNPQQERLFERLRSAGIRASRLQPGAQPAAQQEFREFETGRDQWLAAAQWAKRRLTGDPRQRIAIVAPELAQSRQDIELEFTRTLCPTHLINPDKYYDRPFHIALGRQLATYPVVRSAINLLNLFTEKPVRFETIACMLIDPWIRGAARDRAQRHRLEYRYRQQFAHETTMRDAWERIIQDTTHPDSDETETTPGLAAIFSRIKPLLIGQGERKTCSEWAEIFTQWLDGFGWPGDETLSSAEHQTVQAFRKEILNLATLDLIKQRTTLGEALSILTERLTTQPFEPESAKVNIEIMGILESSGIQFDAVWFGNLTEKEWPPRLNKNPFIPASIQTKAGYFKADFKLNQDCAGKLQEQLTRQCREIVFSRIRLEEGVEQPPSPLVQWPEELSAATPLEPSLLERYQQHKPTLEVFEDYNGAPVTTPDIRGGTAVIEDHSACPFRSYAIHRLNARENEYRQPGLDAMGLGILIHRILEKIWRQVKTRKELRTMMRGTGLDPLIMGAIDECSQPGFSQGGLGKGFSEIQTDWLVSLIRQWFEEMEMGRRQDFQVIETEKKYSLELGGLKLSIKVDRIDRLADGSCVLIDYKTGTTGTLSSWVGARPQRPQLPLYALAIIQNSGNNDSIECMAYGRVRHADCNYQGISIHQEFQLDIGEKKPKVVPLEKARVGHRPLSLDWNELLAHWETALGKLAQSFAKGHAEVNPRDLKVCGNCNLLSLCRRHQLAVEPDADTDTPA